MRHIHKHIGYANLTSALAIVIALGTGTAYAVSQLPPKSVGTLQLRPGAVTADKLRKNAVTAQKIKSLAVSGGKIANGSITSAKIADGSVTAAKIANGSIADPKIADDSITGSKVSEGTLSGVPSAAAADFTPFADTSNPEAFAQVDKDGTVLAAFSKGIGGADVKQGETAGIYCVNIPGFAPRGVQATPLPRPAEEAPDTDVSVFVKFGAPTSCPSAQIEVRTYNAGALKEESFFFMAYR